jgi:hypothetical protein
METTSKIIETEDTRFTKDEALCTAELPVLGFISCETGAWHQMARMLEKPALVDQASFMYDDVEGLDEAFWRRQRKEVLVVVGAHYLAEFVR